jgi:pSer/pThr/pTyr-binding forkhead associated (FHA) protein
MDVRFVVITPASQKRVVAVRLPILVGRADEARFRIQQDSVSRRHCEFLVKDDVVFVRDLGSTNGTLLDDEEIPASVATRVPPGAIVRIGGIAFRVEYESAAAPAAVAPAGDDTVPLPAAEAEAEAEQMAADEPDAPFAGLVTAEPAPAVEPGWLPEADAPPAAAADDENLNDFFKSLS